MKRHPVSWHVPFGRMPATMSSSLPEGVSARRSAWSEKETHCHPPVVVSAHTPVKQNAAGIVLIRQLQLHGSSVSWVITFLKKQKKQPLKNTTKKLPLSVQVLLVWLQQTTLHF